MQIIPNAGKPRTFDEVCGIDGAFAQFVEKKQNAIAKMNRDVDARIRIANTKKNPWGNGNAPKDGGNDDFTFANCEGFDAIAVA